jgi:hypothetical protein
VLLTGGERRHSTEWHCSVSSFGRRDEDRPWLLDALLHRPVVSDTGGALAEPTSGSAELSVVLALNPADEESAYGKNPAGHRSFFKAHDKYAKNTTWAMAILRAEQGDRGNASCSSAMPGKVMWEDPSKFVIVVTFKLQCSTHPERIQLSFALAARKTSTVAHKEWPEVDACDVHASPLFLTSATVANDNNRNDLPLRSKVDFFSKGARKPLTPRDFPFRLTTTTLNGFKFWKKVHSLSTLRFWVDYQTALGVELIVIYVVDDSMEKYHEVLKDCLNTPRVLLVHWWFGTKRVWGFELQHAQQTHVALLLQHVSMWQAHLDVDEFFSLPPSRLKNLSPVGPSHPSMGTSLLAKALHAHRASGASCVLLQRDEYAHFPTGRANPTCSIADCSIPRMGKRVSADSVVTRIIPSKPLMVPPKVIVIPNSVQYMSPHSVAQRRWGKRCSSIPDLKVAHFKHFCTHRLSFNDSTDREDLEAKRVSTNAVFAASHVLNLTYCSEAVEGGRIRGFNISMTTPRRLLESTKESVSQSQRSGEYDGGELSLSNASCAIVLSSGSLLKCPYGSSIDAHDAVFRFNMAPTSLRFAPYVGKKTTVQVVHFKDTSPGQRFARSKAHLDQWGLSWPVDQGVFSDERWYLKYKRSHNKWILGSKELLKYCNAKMKKVCSSGMLTALWAQRECRSLTIFGLEHDPCYPYHYYDKVNFNLTGKPMCPEGKLGPRNIRGYGHGEHDMDREHEWLLRVAQSGGITIAKTCRASPIYQAALALTPTAAEGGLSDRQPFGVPSTTPIRLRPTVVQRPPLPGR